MRKTQQELLDALNACTIEAQNHVLENFKDDRFHYFWRWITSKRLSVYLGCSLKQTNIYYNKLFNQGVIDRRVIPGSWNSFGVKAFEEHTLTGDDYFYPNNE